MQIKVKDLFTAIMLILPANEHMHNLASDAQARSIMLLRLSPVPRLLPAFQCCTLKNGGSLGTRLAQARPMFYIRLV